MTRSFPGSVEQRADGEGRSRSRRFALGAQAHEIRSEKKKSRTTGPAFFTRAHLRTKCANTDRQYPFPCFPPVTSSGDNAPKCAFRVTTVSQQWRGGGDGGSWPLRPSPNAFTREKFFWQKAFRFSVCVRRPGPPSANRRGDRTAELDRRLQEDLTARKASADELLIFLPRETIAAQCLLRT